MPRGQEELARGFYRDLLGLEEKPKPPNLAKRGGAWFRGANVEIHLGVEQDFRPAKKAHPALLVRGLKELERRCREQGVEVVRDEPLRGYERFYLSDPFGNRIEILEPVE